MNLIVTVSQSFNRIPDGTIWTKTQHPYSMWQRYLHVFNHVRVVARIQEAPSVRPDWIRADGKGVEFAPVPQFHGPWQYLLNARQINKALGNAFDPSYAVILLTYATLSSLMGPLLRRTGHPFGIQVGSDPFNSFAPDAMKHPLRPFFRWWFVRQLQRQCTEACATAYVTEHALQRRYPPTPQTFTTHYSDVELPDDALACSPRLPRPGQREFTLIFVGGLTRLRKAPDVLIDAIAISAAQGLNLKLVLVGGGKEQAELEARAAAHNLGERVLFLGHVPAGRAVREQLDKADLFILPSRAEGTPRAMIEAMARGLPCIGSDVSGIPELLSDEDTVPPGDVLALARKIREVVTDSERMARMSARNLENAAKFSSEILRERWIAFYRAVRDQTEAWRDSQPG